MSSDIQIDSDPVEDLLAEYPKQTLVANAWLYAPGIRYQETAKLLDTSNEHARRTYRALEAGDLDVETVIDPVVQKKLGELLEKEGILENIPGPAKVRESIEEVPKWWVEGKRAPFSVNTKAKDDSLPGTAKERLLAAWYLITYTEEEIVNHDLAVVAECSEEHARRIRNAAENGEFDQTEFETISNAVWETIAEKLISEGIITEDEKSELPGAEAIEEDKTELPIETIKEEISEQEILELANEIASKDTKSANRSHPPKIQDSSPSTGMISAGKVQRVRDILDTLRREAEATEDVKAEFIANEAVAQLDMLLHNTEEDSEDS